MPDVDIDSVPYVAAANQRRRSEPITLIVLHSGETNEGNTAAEGMAAYFASGNTIGSAHLCVDNDSVVRCAPDENRTNGAGGVNEFALHLEQAGRAGQTAQEWADPYSSALIDNTAGCVRAWIRKYPQIRPVFLDAAALARGERYGITTHAEVTQVFAGNDGHWDPGPNYPIAALIDKVRGTPSEVPEEDENVKPNAVVKDKTKPDGKWWWCRGEVRSWVKNGAVIDILAISGVDVRHEGGHNFPIEVPPEFIELFREQ